MSVFGNAIVSFTPLMILMFRGFTFYILCAQCKKMGLKNWLPYFGQFLKPSRYQEVQSFETLLASPVNMLNLTKQAK